MGKRARFVAVHFPAFESTLAIRSALTAKARFEAPKTWLSLSERCSKQVKQQETRENLTFSESGETES